MSERPRSIEELRLAGQLADVDLPRSAVRVLAACATAGDLTHDLLFHDPAAREAFLWLSGSPDCFSKPELRATLLRTFVIDHLAAAFGDRNPDALNVGIFPWLGTRSRRLRRARWVDIDAPPIAALRTHLLPQRPGLVQVACSPLDFKWVDAVVGSSPRQLFLVLDESAVDLPAKRRIRLFDELVSRVAPGSELTMAFDERWGLRPTNWTDPVSALEFVVREPGGASVHRYPRLRLVDAREYDETIRWSLVGLSSIARQRAGSRFVSVAHARFV